MNGRATSCKNHLRKCLLAHKMVSGGEGGQTLGRSGAAKHHLYQVAWCLLHRPQLVPERRRRRPLLRLGRVLVVPLRHLGARRMTEQALHNTFPHPTTRLPSSEAGA